MIGNEYLFPAGYGGNANTELGIVATQSPMQLVEEAIGSLNGGEPSAYEKYYEEYYKDSEFETTNPYNVAP